MTSSSKKTGTGNTATRKNKTKNGGAQSRNAKSSSQKPTALRVRAYQVGFGDSFLLTFQYATENKHVLIDFGSVRLPDNAPKDQLMRVAQDIKLVCGTDGLTALVETHRHRDHISGFATDTKNAPGTIIAALHPQLVLHPWTEDPNANPSGQAATSTGSHTQAFVGRLAAMQAFSGRACVEAQQLQVRNSAEFKPELRFAGENNLPNDSAIRNLMNMAPAQDHEYLNCGRKTRLASLLPGVKVWVLGPPTLQQSNAIRKETSTNADEFWQLQKSTVTFDHSEYFRGVSEWKGDPPEPYRWFLRRADKVRAEQMLGLVRILDKTMNNTSLILLFEAAGRRFLFPGDAQWENWSYALNQPKLKALLTNVQLYKVGHHGSRNATPKSMWNVLKGNSHQHLNTLVSTLEGVFGKEESHTEVPRSTLITELENNSELRTTAGQTALSQDVVFSF